jgi:DNA invertase Pin-like site-specific DNA recombinase
MSMSKQNAPKPKPAISYIRVSTAKQGHSGLGLEAQRVSVQAFAQANGYEIVQEFLEIESGKNDSRPVLAKAKAAVKKLSACLVFAKLDRLARSVRFIAEIMDSTMDFRVADLPHADRVTLQIMAIMGEQEARACSERTKAALAAAKARGVLLGAQNPACRNLPEGSYKKGAQRVKAQAQAAYVDILPEILAMQNDGFSLHAIASMLNAKGHVTRTGKPWFPMQVSRALNRATFS